MRRGNAARIHGAARVEPALETVNTALYMDIPWIPGGFNISFEGEGAEAKLIVYANCRVSSGMDEKSAPTEAGRKRVKWA
jgi:hypothetical protein